MKTEKIKCKFSLCFANTYRLVKYSLYLLLGFLYAVRRQKPIVVLAYHSVALNEDFYSVCPVNFRRQIEYLKREYEIVPLSDIIEFLTSKKRLPMRSVALTFDDGFHDFYSNVFPYLEKYHLPATIFIATGYVGKTWPQGKQNAKMLTWEEISEMSKKNIEIAVHTVSHPNLQKISLKDARKEILLSKTQTEERIRKEVNFFCYPFGKITPEIVFLVANLGFKGACGNVGTIRPNTNRFLINRVQVDSSISFPLFLARLTKATDLLEKVESFFTNHARAKNLRG